VWDISERRDHACDVVTATSGTGEVIVNFGVTQRDQKAAGEITVQPRRQFALLPRAARNLRDVLRGLIAEADAGGRS